jgi:hypothetical protein
MFTWRTVSFAPIVLAAVLLLLPIRPAMAVDARDLAGWWIAIDRLFPSLYETGVSCRWRSCSSSAAMGASRTGS